jgi:hypothetical protein
VLCISAAATSAVANNTALLKSVDSNDLNVLLDDIEETESIFTRVRVCMGGYIKAEGSKFVPFAHTGYKFDKLVPRVRRVYMYISLSTSSEVMPE